MTYDSSQFDRIAHEFEQAWQQGRSGEFGDWLQRVSPGLKSQLAQRLVPVEIQFRQRRGDQINPASDYHDLGPSFVEQIQHILADHDQAALGKTKSNLASDSEPTVDLCSPLSNDEFEMFEIKHVALNPSSRSPVIGNYKLLQKLGEGGMGEVWMAEQERPVRRKVALKLIKVGLGNKQVIARFETERQVLAMMDHQNIAKVLDANTTSDGLPYVVMELVQGIPFNKYCDQNKLSIDERLQLFIPVCNAIQHAHQKGIIHRDLKPSNVLVSLYDGKPVPKVIDFGLAKALQHTTRLTDKTLFTEFGQVVGTLQYMSPEQAEMNQLDIDTRTDIYSLGIMLYELLTGSTPIEAETLKNNAILQVLATIRDQDPPRPSVRLSSNTIEAVTGISTQRNIDPAKLKNILRGDLDWIVMRAVEKDRTRRYETANGFALDISRYLAGDIVSARPPSTGYRLKKYVRKHKGLVASVASIFTLLLLAVVGTSVGMTRAFIAKQKLETALTEVKTERDRANAEGDWSFHVASVLANQIQGKEQVDEFAKKWKARLDEVQALVGPHDPDLIRQQSLFAVWGWTSTWIELAMTLQQSGSATQTGKTEIQDKLKTWGTRVEQAYKIAADLFQPDDPLWAALVNDHIQWLITERGENLSARFDKLPPEALEQIAPLYDDLVASFSAIYGAHSDEALSMAAQRVWAYQGARQSDRAVAALRDYLVLRRQGGRPSRQLDMVHEMIIKAFQKNELVDPVVYGEFMWRYYTDAIKVYPSNSAARKMAHDQFTQSLAETKEVIFAENSEVFFAENSADAEYYHLAVITREAGRGDLALKAITPLKERLGAELVSTHPHRLAVDLLYVICLREAGRLDEAVEAINSYIETVVRGLGEDHSAAITGRLELVKIHEARGDLAAARSTCQDAWKRAESLERPDALVVRQAVNELIRLHEDSDSQSEVQLWRDKLEEFQSDQLKSPHNLDLEAGDLHAAPDGWMALSGDLIANFQSTMTQGPFDGQKCAVLSTLKGTSLLIGSSFRNMFQSFEAAPYRGKKIRFSAAVRVEGEAAADQAQLWLRVDRLKQAKPYLLENMSDRPIRSSKWQRYEIVGVVDEDAEHINIGIMVFGEATAWLDDVRFEIVDE